MGVVLAAALSACLADPDSIFPERIRQTAVNDIIGSYYAFDPFLAASGRQGRSGREYKPNPVRFYDEPEPYHPSPPPRHQAAAKLYKAEPYKPSHHIHSEKPYVPAYEPKAVHEQPPVYHPKSLKPAFVDGKPYKPAYAEVKHHKPSYVEPKPYKPYKPAFDPYHIDFEPYRPNSYADNPDHHYKPGYEASYKPAYVEPEPYKPAYVEPEPYKPAYVEAEPYKPAYVEAKPYKPVYAEPEPYKPAYVEAEPYKPAYVEPKPYKPAYEHYEVEHRPLKPYPESIYDKLDKFPASLTELRNFPLDSEDYKAPHGYGHLPAYVEEPRHAPPKSAYAVP